MDNQEKLTTLGTEDTTRRQTKHKTQHRKQKQKEQLEPHQKPWLGLIIKLAVVATLDLK
jgi:hypothetical protein